MEHRNNNVMYGTTILSIRRGSNVVIAGDGQVSLGPTIMKKSAIKVKKFDKHPVISGFAGATSDAFTLFGRLESKLDQHPGLLMRACVELAKDWRSDRYLRKLEAMMIVADTKVSLVISGTGDILEPEDGIAAIGSGGNFALSAAKALVDNSQDCDLCKKMSLREIAKKAMKIAADICVYTNNELVIEEMGEE